MGHRVILVYSDKYLGHVPPIDHPERPSRIVTAYESLRYRGLIKRLVEVRPPMGDEDLPYTVHAPDYVNSVRELSSAGGGFLDADTYVVSDTFEVALYAIGGVVRGAEEMLGSPGTRVFALLRPPGHHAGIRGRAMRAPSLGFCIFNNVAVAARYLQQQGLSRVAIVDIDCHHGNGTQDIFNSDDTVLFISLHQDPETLYPGTGWANDIGSGEGRGYTINLPFPPGSGDDVYLYAFNEIVLPVLQEFEPDAILVSAGYDAYKGDPLGDLLVSSYGYWEVFSMLSKLADEKAAGRIMAVLEGGYGAGLARGVPASVAALMGEELEIDPPTRSRSTARERVKRTVKEVKRLLKDWWRSLD